MVASKKTLILLVFVITLIWTAALTLPDGKTHLWAQTSLGRSGLIIKSASGKFAVVNPTGEEVWSQLSQVLPFYERQIDLMVLTDRKISPTKLFSRYQVSQVWTQDDQSTYDGIKVEQILGEKRLIWEELGFHFWSLPDQPAYLEISRADKAVGVVQKNNSSFWESLPFTIQAELLIAAPDNQSLNLIPGGWGKSLFSDGEIVWQKDSWYSEKVP